MKTKLPTTQDIYSFFAFFGSLVACSFTGHAQGTVSVVSPGSPPDRAQMLQVSAERLPSTISIDLGDIPLGEQTLKWVAITNRSGEQFSPKVVKSDCGCALGFVLDTVVENGEDCRVCIRATPKNLGAFSRSISIANSEGSDRSIVLRIDGKVKQRFSTEPQVLRLLSRSP